MKLGDFKFLKRENKGDREMAYLGFGNSAYNQGYSTRPHIQGQTIYDAPFQSLPGPVSSSWDWFHGKRNAYEHQTLLAVHGANNVIQGNDGIGNPFYDLYMGQPSNSFPSSYTAYQNDYPQQPTGSLFRNNVGLGGSSLNQFQNALISGINTINGQNSVSGGGVNFNANNHLNWISQAGNFSGNQSYPHPHSFFYQPPTINPSIMANLGFGGHNAFRW